MPDKFDLSRLEGVGEREQVRYLLESILARSHPEVARGLMLATIPYSYDESLMRALRARGDDKDQRMLDRLAELPFVEALAGGRDGPLEYAVQRLERDVLQRIFIRQQPKEYMEAHWRAFHYWRQAQDVDPSVRSLNILTHWLLVDSQAEGADELDSVAYLVETFRLYVSERRLAAVQRLIARVGETLPYLEALESPWAGQLADLLQLLSARLDQFRRHWQSSARRIASLRQKFESGTLWPSLTPYYHRLNGRQSTHDGDYVCAVEQFSVALEYFEDELGNSLSRAAGADRGMTMIDLGDTLLNLARSVRGPQEDVHSVLGLGGRLRDAARALLALPVLVYLTWHFGPRVWRPDFWPVLREDWIIIRLFARAQRWYRQADRLLERSADALLADGAAKDGQRLSAIRLQKVLADERLAFLHLELADATQASRVFLDLLRGRQAELSPYRRAISRAGLAAAYLQLGRHEDARSLLRLALPVLIALEDQPLVARTRQNLAEASLALGDSVSAAEQFGAASAVFRELGDWTTATVVAERLEQLAGRGQLDLAQFPELATALELAQRQYGARFRHPYLKAFRRIAMVALVISLLLIPLLSTNLRSDTDLVPQIHFRAAPLLNTEQRVSAELSQGIAAANAVASAGAEVVLAWLLLAASGYLGGSFLAGLATLLVTPLQTVQERGRAATVTLTGEHLIQGDKRLPWTAISGVVQADVSLWDRRLMDESKFAVLGGAVTLDIGGNSNWYPALKRRIIRKLSPGFTVDDLSQDLLRDPIGLLYLANLLFLSLTLFLVEVAPEFIWRDWPGLRYSLGELYPYLYPGLFILPLWWLLVNPLRVNYRLEPRTRRPWFLLAAAALLMVYHVATAYRPLFTPVNLFVPITAVIMAVSAATVVWRSVENGDRVYSRFVRAFTVVVAALFALAILSVVRRHLQAYHHWTLGNFYRDRALTGDLVDDFVLAEHSYRQAAVVDRARLLGVDPHRAANWPLGVPDSDDFIWQAATRSRAAILVQLTRYDEAIALYDELLAYTSRPELVYAGRALARQSAGTTVLGDGQSETSTPVSPDVEGTAVGSGMENDAVAYRESLSDLDRALMARPAPRYYLWQAVTQHSLGQLDQALSSYESALGSRDYAGQRLDENERVYALLGIGWIRYQREQFELARRSFEETTALVPDLAEGWLALGYALYAQDDYYRALVIWQQGLALAPGEPTILASLGTLFWKFGNSQCLEYRQSVEYLTRSINQGLASGQSDREVAFTYRTRAQLKFLLADLCTPDEDNEAKIAAFEAAAEDYTRAFVLEPTNAFYVHMRARLIYASWTVSERSGPSARRPLIRALADLDTALAINPVDQGRYQPNRYRNLVLNALTDGGNSNLVRGRLDFQAENYLWALGYYKMVADYPIEDRPSAQIEAAFGAGLSALSLGAEAATLEPVALTDMADDLRQETGLAVQPDNLAQALAEAATGWYQAAVERALDEGDLNAIREAWLQLTASSENQAFEVPASIEQTFHASGVDLG